MLRRIFGLQREVVARDEEDCIKGSSTFQQILG
jgi:hypothetical protein